MTYSETTIEALAYMEKYATSEESLPMRRRLREVAQYLKQQETYGEKWLEATNQVSRNIL